MENRLGSYIVFLVYTFLMFVFLIYAIGPLMGHSFFNKSQIIPVSFKNKQTDIGLTVGR